MFSYLVASSIAVAGISNPLTVNAPLNLSSSSYIALGDSYSAGFYGANVSDEQLCSRTSDAHPELTGKSLRLETVNLACSGAKIKAGILGTQSRNDQTNPAQIDSMKMTPNPALISMSIGGNDLGWANFFKKCQTSTCGTLDDDALLEKYSATIGRNIGTVLSDIHTFYGANTPPVITIGYGTFIPANHIECVSLKGIDQYEINWLRDRMFTRLNQAVADASSKYDFAHYVHVDNMTGHEVCTDDSYTYPTNSSGYLHPNAKGQKAISDKVIEAYTSLKR